MRWSYKTVLYELKKDGLLGSSFLDESEIEFSLNEFGQSGWELTSMLETSDGVIAVFKQPLAIPASVSVDEGEQKSPLKTEHGLYISEDLELESEPEPEPDAPKLNELPEIADKLEDAELAVREEKEHPLSPGNHREIEESRETEPQESSDVGTIRIE